MREAVIVSAARTAIGKARGTLAPVPAHELGAIAVREAVKRANIDPNEIDDVIFGNLMANEVANIGRVVALGAGLPYSVPGLTLDRQCGSGLNAFAYASILIQAGYADVLVAGGVESDSRRCYVMEKPTTAYQVMPPQWAKIKSAYKDEDNISMGLTAENLAERFSISREECDKFAEDSHKKAAAAWEKGAFNEQIVPVEVNIGKGKTIHFVKDEALRPDTTVEILSKLPPVFKEGGVVTAGNSSPMSDGAGAVVVMEKSKAKALGLPILGKFKGYACTGLDPKIMGYGPVYATEKLFKITGMNMKDIDLIEMNEAFAAQSIACIHGLDIDTDKLNVNGGAIALGHPLAGTGAILLAKMVYALKDRNLSTGLITFCAGGGMGVSVIIERE
ncbi:thiolase family protein [Clostridium sp. SYSU_GA19001]|uniref:thiolase family protein n=1 Tax=Clostridium caldaquaticum TaxID=2940653 RepID=UPI002076DF86|nr:thiolase family protein [Clostridium caldaquaticum]MCM8711245.1 thiolase family protein [Clostridium caldaquaticum]